MALIQFKRGTRAELDAAAGAGQLNEAEPVLVTDQGMVAVATGTSAYVDLASSVATPNEYAKFTTVDSTNVANLTTEINWTADPVGNGVFPITSGTEISVPTAGDWRIDATVGFNGNNRVEGVVTVLVNGVPVAGEVASNYALRDGTHASGVTVLSTALTLAVTDLLEIRAEAVAAGLSTVRAEETRLVLSRLDGAVGGAVTGLTPDDIDDSGTAEKFVTPITQAAFDALSQAEQDAGVFIITDPAPLTAASLEHIAPRVDNTAAITILQTDHASTIRSTAAAATTVTGPTELDDGTTVRIRCNGVGGLTFAGPVQPGALTTIIQGQAMDATWDDVAAFWDLDGGTSA